MKIQLSDKRIVPDAVTVWHEHGPEVDIVMDLKRLTFAPGSIEKIYAFHVLEHFLAPEVDSALRNWKALLRKGGKMFLVNDDFEFVCRSFIGGDLSIEQFNASFSRPTHFTRDNSISSLQAVGFQPGEIVLWFADVTDEFKKEQHELVVAVSV